MDIYEQFIVNLLKDYKSLNKFIKEENIGTFLLRILDRKKIVSDSQFKNYKKVLKYFDLNIPNLEFKVFEEHVEAYGSLKELKDFKTKYNIPNNIIFEKYKETWHLAFHGFLAEYIKLKKIPKEIIVNTIKNQNFMKL